MSYEVLGRNDTYWSCHQGAWRIIRGSRQPSGGCQKALLSNATKADMANIHPEAIWTTTDRR